MHINSFLLVFPCCALPLAGAQFGGGRAHPSDWGIEEEEERDPASRAWSAPEDTYDYSVEFGGTGVLGLRLSAALQVTEIVDNSEAARSTIHVRDVLVALNGNDLTGKPLSDVLEQLQNKGGSSTRVLRFRPHVQEHDRARIAAVALDGQSGLGIGCVRACARDSRVAAAAGQPIHSYLPPG